MTVVLIKLRGYWSGLGILHVPWQQNMVNVSSLDMHGVLVRGKVSISVPASWREYCFGTQVYIYCLILLHRQSIH